MSKSILEPTEDNLKETFLNDHIGRNEELVYFIKMLLDIPCGSTIALNGDWGCGKTFFVKQVKMILDAYNPNNDIGELNESDLQDIQNHFLNIQKNYCVQYDINRYATVYYDAWKNDNSDDPFLSLLYTIATRMNSNVPEDRFEVIKSTFSKVLSCITGIASLYTPINLNAITESLKGLLKSKDDIFSNIKREANLDKRIKEFFNVIFDDEEERKIIVFVDELDRCKPSFAMAFLEKVKHYFNNDRTVFVFSCNINELQHSIRTYYGNEFNASKYLDRFFNYYIELGYPNIKNYLTNLGVSSDTLGMIIKDVSQHFHFQLREACKFYDCMSKALGKYNVIKYQSGSIEQISLSYLITLVLPYTIGLRFHNINSYNDFINGRYFDDYLVFMKKTIFYTRDINLKLLNPDEKYDEARTFISGGVKHLTRDSKLKSFYNDIFPYRQLNGEVEYGAVILSQPVIDVFKKIIHGTSFMADYKDV